MIFNRWAPGRIALAACMALLAQNRAGAQSVVFSNGNKGIARFADKYGAGPRQPSRPTAPSASGIPYYSKGFASLKGKSVTLRLIGTDPGAGAASTTIPAVIQPLRVVFSDGTVLDGTDVVAAVASSPVFATADYTFGAVDVGTTQYLDAMQRAQFWNLTGFSQSGYHLLLGSPTVNPAITVNVPADKGFAITSSAGVLIGLVDNAYLSAIIDGVATGGAFAPNQLPLIVTDNVLQYDSAGCCVIGYHSSQSGSPATAQTWVYSAWVRTNTFGASFDDAVGLSHELTEWANDPFVGDFSTLNVIPPAVLPGQGACIINFETGDPAEAVAGGSFAQTIGGVTYHLQDVATLWWYLHTSPSPAANGWYSVNGLFRQPSSLCGPG